MSTEEIEFHRLEQSDSHNNNSSEASLIPSSLVSDNHIESIEESVELARDDVLPPPAAKKKAFYRRHPRRCCLLSFLVLAACGIVIWRLVMGNKYGKVDESAAHLTFDSPGSAGYSRPVALQPESIKVLVWNLKKGQMSGLETDLPNLASDRDLLVLSEGELNERGKGIFNSINNTHWEMGVAFTYKRDGDAPTGTMIGSKVLPTWAAVKQTEDVEPIINTPKCMMFAKFPVNKSSSADGSSSSSSSSGPASAVVTNSTVSLLVISIHGINAVSADALDRQLAQATEQIRAHDGPVIFAGDFNTNTSEKVSRLRALIASLDMLEAKLRDGDDRKKVFGQYIDYIFTRGLKVMDSYVLGQIDSSDHKPLLAEVQLA